MYLNLNVFKHELPYVIHVSKGLSLNVRDRQPFSHLVKDKTLKLTIFNRPSKSSNETTVDLQMREKILLILCLLIKKQGLCCF